METTIKFEKGVNKLGQVTLVCTVGKYKSWDSMSQQDYNRLTYTNPMYIKDIFNRLAEQASSKFLNDNLDSDIFSVLDSENEVNPPQPSQEEQIKDLQQRGIIV